MLNSFQRWAILYAEQHGFDVYPLANWVILEKDGVGQILMSEQGVRDACSSSR